MQIKRKRFIIVAMIIFTFILIRLIQSFFGGSLGLKPVAHGCLGAIIESKKILKIFPRGHFKLKTPIFLQYNVQPELQNVPGGVQTYFNSKYYCLGQDVWFGE